MTVNLSQPAACNILTHAGMYVLFLRRLAVLAYTHRYLHLLTAAYIDLHLLTYVISIYIYIYKYRQIDLCIYVDLQTLWYTYIYLHLLTYAYSFAVRTLLL